MSLTPYRKIDQSTWSRQDHYKYYTEKLKVNYSMTARLDVTRLRAECDRFGVHFYAAFIWCTSNVVNRLPFMKMMTDEEGNPGVWDVIHPNYTIFHKEDHTFSDCWSEYDADFATFYKRIETDIEAAKKVRGVKAKAGQPASCPALFGSRGVVLWGKGDQVFGSYSVHAQQILPLMVATPMPTAV